MQHLTLNTGHVVERSWPAQAALDAMRPLIRDSGGQIPGLNIYLAMGRQEHGAYFQFATEPGLVDTPAVCAVACWAGEKASGIWQFALGGYRYLERPLRQFDLWRDPPAGPPGPGPWVCTWLTPFSQALDLTDIQMVADLEGIVAFALWEHYLPLGSP